MQSREGCVRLRDALKCIGMHLGGYHYSHVEMSLVVVGDKFAKAACRVTSPFDCTKQTKR